MEQSIWLKHCTPFNRTTGEDTHSTLGVYNWTKL